jgi:micrococcal nuclease
MLPPPCQPVRKLILTLLIVALAALGGRAVLAQPEDGRVTRVVDGDTLHVQVDGRDETVRLLGIDTPELHKPATPVECGAREASRAMEKLADGRKVTLTTDPTQDERDRYGRLLAYAVTTGGTDLGEAILRRGWAEVALFDGPFERLAQYRVAAANARHADRGVVAACDGDFHSAS